MAFSSGNSDRQSSLDDDDSILLPMLRSDSGQENMRKHDVIQYQRGVTSTHV
jgi:hypothetical protein